MAKSSEAFVQHEETYNGLMAKWNEGEFVTYGGSLPLKTGKRSSWVFNELRAVRVNLIACKRAGMEFELKKALETLLEIEKPLLQMVNEDSTS